MQGSVAEAERELRAVAQRHPGYALAWYNLGKAVQEQERQEHAIEHFRRAIALEPALAEAGIWRGVTGVYDVSPDFRPLIGEIPGVSGLYVAAGFSGMGFKISPAA